MEACELTHLERQPIDITLARKQHAEYCQCLRELGAEVITLPAEPDFPDAVFVEDPAVVLDEAAIMTRLGAASRRGESATLALELARHRSLSWMNAPATLEGGDVMRVGRTLFVGLSTRSNQEGFQQLATKAGCVGYRTQPVMVHGCLHLKSAVSHLGDDTVLVHAPWVDASAFVGLNVVEVPEGETEGANVLMVGGAVLVAAGFPRTAEKIERLGRKVVLLDNSEIRKAEGALTCCSLLLS